MVGEYDSTGTEIRTYGWKPGSTWSTGPLFMKIGIEYYFYHNDHLGTPQKMTGVNGGVVWKAKYEAFGEAEVDIKSTITNNLRFPGQYYDGETGLHYNFHRYYDPRAGSYLRLDPVGLLVDGTNSDRPKNMYFYSENNPLKIIDPLGKRCWTGGAGAVGGIGIGVSFTIQVICCDDECDDRVKCCMVTSICTCWGAGATVSTIFGTATSNRSGSSCYWTGSYKMISVGLGGGATAGIGPGLGLFYCCCFHSSSCD